MTKLKNGDRDILIKPQDRKNFKAGLATITHYMQGIDDQRESIKETTDDLAATYGLDKKLVRKMAATMYKHNYADVQEENRHFELLYETVIEGKHTGSTTDPLDVEDSDEEEAA